MLKQSASKSCVRKRTLTASQGGGVDRIQNWAKRTRPSASSFRVHISRDVHYISQLCSLHNGDPSCITMRKPCSHFLLLEDALNE